MNVLTFAKRRSGVALFSALAVLALLVAMSTVFARSNFVARRFVRDRADANAAFNAAESGLAIAAAAIAAGEASGERSGELATSRYTVRWHPAPGDPGGYEVVAEGASVHPGSPATRRSVAATLDRGVDAGIRVRDWSER